MKIYPQNAEQPLIDFMDQIRSQLNQWRALHFHFSGLQPANKQPHHFESILTIVQEQLGAYRGSAFLCHDGDLVIIYEHAGSLSINTMLTDFRFLFADDPLASASYISGQPDSFYTAYDLSFAFDQFFYMGLHKLALIKQVNETAVEALQVQNEPLPHPSVFLKEAQHRKERKQLKILVAEDSYFSRQMIRQALAPKYEVLLAKNGWEGLAMYLSHAPNITFMDIDMPQMNGHEVLKKIKELDAHPFVIMLTASNLSQDIKSAVAEGAKGYIVKPFTVAKLTAYIDQYCRENGHQMTR